RFSSFFEVARVRSRRTFDCRGGNEKGSTAGRCCAETRLKIISQPMLLLRPDSGHRLNCESRYAVAERVSTDFIFAGRAGHSCDCRRKYQEMGAPSFALFEGWERDSLAIGVS